jgi:phage baseplate assembly protein gpV
MDDPTLPLVLLGKVVSTLDEKKLGRVQVEIPGYAGPLKMPWLRVVQQTASEKHGVFFLPEIGDQVLILRGAGNTPEGMFILGSLYHGKANPLTPDPDDKNDTKQIVTRHGHQITFIDTADAAQILIKAGKKELNILLDEAEATIFIASEDIVHVSGATIKIEGDDFSFEASNSIVLKGKTVSIEGSSEVAVKGGAIAVG